MSEVVIIQVEDVDMGKHANAQLRDYFSDIKERKLRKVTEIPFVLDKMLEDNKGAIVLVDTTERKYMEQVVQKIMDIEIEKGKPVQKLFVEKKNESMERFQKRVQEASRENAEKLADKVKNLSEEG